MLLFDFDLERNIPTFFSFLLLFLIAILLFLIHRSENRPKEYHWKLLSFIFIYLSIDEMIELHERSMIPIRDTFNLSGLLYFSWVIPYTLIIIVLGLVYYPFLKKLPRKYRHQFLFAGAVYILGAMGFELIGGWQLDLYGPDMLVYKLLYSIEELLEMAGLIIFLHALLSCFVELRNCPE